MTNPVVTTQCKDLTSLLPKGFKLPSPTEDAILEDVFSKINAALNKNPNYSKRWNGLINEAKKTGDVNRVHKFVMSTSRTISRNLSRLPSPSSWSVREAPAEGRPKGRGRPTRTERRHQPQTDIGGIGIVQGSLLERSGQRTLSPRAVKRTSGV